MSGAFGGPRWRLVSYDRVARAVRYSRLGLLDEERRSGRPPPCDLPYEHILHVFRNSHALWPYNADTIRTLRPGKRPSKNVSPPPPTHRVGDSRTTPQEIRMMKRTLTLSAAAALMLSATALAQKPQDTGEEKEPAKTLTIGD